MTFKQVASVGVAVVAMGLLAGCSSASTGPTGTASPSSGGGAVTIVQLDGLMGTTPNGAPNCYPANPKVQGVYGEEWCFGSTYGGGKLNYGSVYRIKPDGTQFETLASFDLTNGLIPAQSPAMTEDRTALYGVTTQAGDAGLGVLYTVDLASGDLSEVTSLTPNLTGSTPQGSVIIQDGVIYGQTGQNGGNSGGAIWSMTIGDTSTLKQLHSFVYGSNADVAIPFGALAYNPNDGLLYGQAFNGGANGLGGLFSLNPDGSGYQLRYSLSKEIGGMPQMGAPLIGSDGLIYSNEWLGGANGLGSILAFNPSTNQVTSVFNYTKQTGSQPYSTLAESKSGKWLYSVTWQNGANSAGTILAVSKDGSQSHVLFEFDSAKTGGNTNSNVSLSEDGKHLIVAMAGGGKNGVGTLLSLEVPSDYR